MSKNHVLIVGGGFGGVKAALELTGVRGCIVTLVSDNDHLRYYPELYHAATGGRRAGASIPLRDILQGKQVRFMHAKADKLNCAKKEIVTSDGQHIPYDQLVLALGNVTNYFGIKGLREYSYGIKSTEEAERFKKHLHQQLAMAGAPDLNYVIVGGGPTGIELAGALPGYLHAIMRKHNIQKRSVHIELVEAAPQLLPRSPRSVSRAVEKRLRRLGIKLMLGTAVQGETPDTLMAGGTSLQSHTVVWTAGVTNNPFFQKNNFRLTDRGKVEVDEYLQAEPDIFVIGDNAGTPYSGMAQTALYDAEFTAANIKRQMAGKMPASYLPKKPVTVIPVGPHWASVEWGNVTCNGLLGYLAHIFVDLVAFHDMESWPKAGSQWLTSMEEERLDCPHCTKTGA